MHRIILSIIAALALAGCASKYKSVAYEAPKAKLVAQAGFYVMQPPNGQYNAHTYPDSGYATARAVVQALAPHTNKFLQATSVEDLDSAISKAKQGNLRYVFQTTILNWEDRATEWSGIPDKISLSFVIYDVQTGEKVASAISNASSKWATFGGDHPQDLLPIPTKKFVDEIL